MTYRTVVLANGKIDANALPPFPPASEVEVLVRDKLASLQTMFAKLAEIGSASKSTYEGAISREDMYEDRAS